MKRIYDKKHRVLTWPELTVYGGILWRRYPGCRGVDYFGRTVGKRKELLHRRIWEDLHGPIPVGFVVHHKDEDRANNEPGNLEMMDAAEHLRLHRRGKRNSRFALQRVQCLGCGQAVEKWSSVPLKYCSPNCGRRHRKVLRRV